MHGSAFLRQTQTNTRAVLSWNKPDQKMMNVNQICRTFRKWARTNLFDDNGSVGFDENDAVVGDDDDFVDGRTDALPDLLEIDGHVLVGPDDDVIEEQHGGAVRLDSLVEEADIFQKATRAGGCKTKLLWTTWQKKKISRTPNWTQLPLLDRKKHLNFNILEVWFFRRVSA